MYRNKTNPKNVGAIKIFMGSSTGNMLVDDYTVLNSIFSKCPALIATHCEDEKTVRNNLMLAKKKFGSTFPNPVVGCIIVKKNKIISSGVTASEGRPHAEEIALKKAGSKARGSSMYVTLEPCFHKSNNGSCADQILRSGIKTLYIAKHDPDIRTNKKSIKKLKKNGIDV